jgi:hypothetical protein
MRRLELRDDHVRGDHGMRIEGLAREFHARAGTHHAARAVAAREIWHAHGFSRAACTLQRGSDAIGILRKGREPGAEFHAPAELAQPPPQHLKRARLRQHPHAGIRHVRRRLAPLDAMEFRRSDLLRSIPCHRRRIRPAVRMHRIDHAEIVVHFERARLDALAARPRALIRRDRIHLDDAETHAAPRQVAGEHQPRRARARDQHVDRLALHQPPFETRSAALAWQRRTKCAIFAS